jgi:hypothetical protein
VIQGAGKVVQAPYNGVDAGVKKVVGALKSGVIAGGEAIKNIPQVQKVTETGRKVVNVEMESVSEGTNKIVNTTRGRAKEVLTSVSILVGSKDRVGGSGGCQWSNSC